jgi:RNA polymerase sigma factor (TIGR02999 family)
MSAISNNENEQLDKLVYQQLKSLARKLMVKERDNHTLSATDLVHEAFMKLADGELSFNDQNHFYQTFARQMRRVLVNYSYHKSSKKNKGSVVHLTDSLGLVKDDFADFNEINNAIEHLHALDERSAKCVELVYFTQLSQAQAAKCLDVSLATLERDLKFGRVVMHQYIEGLN